MICVLYRNTQKNARKNTKKIEKNQKKYIIPMNNAFNNLCEVSNSRVIVGHNYRNGLFFSNNKKLSEGDKIYITDNSGKKLTYTIYSKFETTSEDTSFYQRDTNGKAEVTLSTCTDDSSARIIILARED